MTIKKEIKARFEKCLQCSKPVNMNKDHCVQLSTHNREFSPDDFAYFHFPCFETYFNQRVESKMKANVSAMQEQALKLFESPAIKNALSQISGSEIALKMVKMPLVDKPDVNIIVEKKKVEEKIHDRRKRAKGKKSRA